MEDSANYMSIKTFHKVLESIPLLKIRKWNDRDVKFLFKNTYWMGLRPSEAIRLRKEDFKLNNRYVYLGKTKTKKAGDSTIIPLEYVQELETYLEKKPEGRLLPGLKYNTMYLWMKRLGKILDIPAWTTPESESGEKTVGHIMRKSLGKHMNEGLYGDELKGDFVTIQGVMRHKDIGMTVNVYLKLNKENVKEKW